MSPSASSDLGLYCLIGSICPNTLGKYSWIIAPGTASRKYTENIPPKNENFQIKISDISAQNIDCIYSLELPHWVPTLCFWAKIRKIMYTPVNPSFTIEKWCSGAGGGGGWGGGQNYIDMFSGWFFFFSAKKFWYFILYLHKNICCGYSVRHF